MERIILFDGECNFCDQSVQFIIKRDPKRHFKFASLQSNAGEKLLRKHNAPENLDSLVLLENSTYYVKSSAALRICKNLQGVWKLFYSLLIVPKPVRDFFYGIIAKRRYKWFGKNDSCTLPSPEDKQRFLDQA